MMKQIQVILFTCCLGISLPVVAQDYQGAKRHINTILENAAKFSQYYMNADYDGLANAYCEDAKILPPGADIITGRSAIKDRWILPEGVKILRHEITPTEIKVIGKYAYDMGYYEGKTLRKDGEEISWKGKYLIVWKKEAKDWKMYMDIWNRI